MARQKQPLSYFIENHFLLVYGYLTRAIKNEKILLAHGKDFQKEDKGKKEFNKILAANKKESVQLLADWVEEYISDSQWERCKTAVRQKILAKKRRFKYKSYRLSEDASNKLSYYAQVKGLKKIEALEQLILVAYKKC